MASQYLFLLAKVKTWEQLVCHLHELILSQYLFLLAKVKTKKTPFKGAAVQCRNTYSFLRRSRLEESKDLALREKQVVAIPIPSCEGQDGSGISQPSG